MITHGTLGKFSLDTYLLWVTRFTTLFGVLGEAPLICGKHPSWFTRQFSLQNPTCRPYAGVCFIIYKPYDESICLSLCILALSLANTMTLNLEQAAILFCHLSLL